MRREMIDGEAGNLRLRAAVPRVRNREGPAANADRRCRWGPVSTALIAVMGMLGMLAFAGCFVPNAATTRNPALQRRIAYGVWPMVGHDAAHSSAGSYPGPRKPELLWLFAPKTEAVTAPVVGQDGTVYVLTLRRGFGRPVRASAGAVYALGPDGKIKWTVRAQRRTGERNPEFTSAALGPDGTVYLTSSDGRIGSFTKGGRRKWNVALGAAGLSPPTVGPDGTTFVSADGTLYAVSPSGARRWAFEGADSTRPPLPSRARALGVTWDSAGTLPAVGPDAAVYFASGSYLYALNPNGTRKRSFKANGDVSGVILDPHGGIYVGGGGTLLALNPDMSLQWRRPLPPDSFAPAAVSAEGTVYVVTSEPATRRSRVSALIRGRSAWTAVIAGQAAAGCTIGSDGTIYVGTQQLRLPGDDAILGGNPGEVVVPDLGGRVYALKPSGGVQWAFKTAYGVQSPIVIGRNRTIYFVSGGKLYAVGEK